MSDYASLHPRVRAYAESIVADALISSQNMTDAFEDLQSVITFAGIESDVGPSTPGPDHMAFDRIWRQSLSDRAMVPTRPLDTASLRTLAFGSFVFAGAENPLPVSATLVRDVATGCITGLAAHHTAANPDDAIRALHAAITQKHGVGRRLPGCVHSWPCAGVPSYIFAPDELDDPSRRLFRRCTALGIWPAGIIGEEDWASVHSTLQNYLRHEAGRPSAPPFDLRRIEQLLTCCVVDTLNQIQHSSMSPHELWLTGTQAKNRGRRAAG